MSIIVCSVSSDLASSIRTLNIAQNLNKKVLPFIGIHPWSAQNEDLEEFEQLLLVSRQDISGIGEIGLDRKYVRKEDDYKRQRKIYQHLLELSEKIGKPVQIHSRGSQDEIIETLSSFRLPAALLHWFSGSVGQLKKATEKGYYISFGPTLLYSNRTKILVQNTPKGLLLTETDGPVKYGACFEGRMALPSYIPSVTLSLSHILKMSLEDTMTLVYQNLIRFIGNNIPKASKSIYPVDNPPAATDIGSN